MKKNKVDNEIAIPEEHGSKILPLYYSVSFPNKFVMA